MIWLNVYLYPQFFSCSLTSHLILGEDYSRWLEWHTQYHSTWYGSGWTGLTEDIVTYLHVILPLTFNCSSLKVDRRGSEQLTTCKMDIYFILEVSGLVHLNSSDVEEWECIFFFWRKKSEIHQRPNREYLELWNVHIYVLLSVGGAGIA
jgi:hypothetical protein